MVQTGSRGGSERARARARGGGGSSGEAPDPNSTAASTSSRSSDSHSRRSRCCRVIGHGGSVGVEWVVEFVDKVLGEDLTQIKVIVLFQTAVKPKKCVERTRKQKQERASQINAEERLFLRHVPLLPQARRCGLQSLTRTNKETHLLLSPVRWGKQGEVVALHSSFGPTARNVLSVNGTTDPRKTARS